MSYLRRMSYFLRTWYLHWMSYLRRMSLLLLHLMSFLLCRRLRLLLKDNF